MKPRSVFGPALLDTLGLFLLGMLLLAVLDSTALGLPAALVMPLLLFLSVPYFIWRLRVHRARRSD